MPPKIIQMFMVNYFYDTMRHRVYTSVKEKVYREEFKEAIGSNLANQ